MANNNPIDTRAQDRARALAQERQRAARETEKEDIKLLMSEAWGRRLVWRMLDRAGVYRTTFRTSSEMGFLEGMRNMGLMLVTDIHEVCPDLYVKMLNEAKEATK